MREREREGGGGGEREREREREREMIKRGGVLKRKKMRKQRFFLIKKKSYV